MTDLSLTTKATGGTDKRWLRSHHGREDAVPATISRALLTAGTHYDGNGVIPSGLALGKVTATGLYGPYDAAEDDGRQVLAGFLLEPLQLKSDFSGVTTAVLSGPLLVHGVIEPAFVPTAPTLNTAILTTGQFVFLNTNYIDPLADVKARLAALESA